MASVPRRRARPRRAEGCIIESDGTMRSIDEVIGNEDALRRLRSAVAAQEALLARIRAMLPGELAPHFATPPTVTELLALLDRAGAVVGNDSGPCHLAAFCGVPTFTLFGPQLPEWFAPLHPRADWLEGKPCPYKPCSDYCRFEVPYCMVNTSAEEVWQRLQAFLKRVLPG